MYKRIINYYNYLKIRRSWNKRCKYYEKYYSTQRNL